VCIVNLLCCPVLFCGIDHGVICVMIQDILC
jgi:hypothetical protein